MALAVSEERPARRDLERWSFHAWLVLKLNNLWTWFVLQGLRRWVRAEGPVVERSTATKDSPAQKVEEP